MCVPGIDPVTLALLVGSAGAKTINNYQAAKRADRDIAAGIDAQSRIGRQAMGDVNQEIAKTAASDPAAEQAQSLAGYLAALQQNRGSAEGSIPDVPGASTRYAEDVADAKGAVRQFGNTQADILSRVDAPIRQREREGRSQLRTGQRVDAYSLDAQMADYLARLRASERRPNPWINAMADLVGGYGTTRALYGVGGKVAPKLSSFYKKGTIIDPGTGMPDPFGVYA